MRITEQSTSDASEFMDVALTDNIPERQDSIGYGIPIVSSRTELRRVLNNNCNEEKLIVPSHKSVYICYKTDLGTALMMKSENANEVFGKVDSFAQMLDIHLLNEKEAFMIYELPIGLTFISKDTRNRSFVKDFAEMGLKLIDMGLVSSRFRASDFVTDGRTSLLLNVANLVPYGEGDVYEFSEDDIASWLAYELSVLYWEGVFDESDLYIASSILLKHPKVVDSLDKKYWDRRSKKDVAKLEGNQDMGTARESVFINIVKRKADLHNFIADKI